MSKHIPVHQIHHPFPNVCGCGFFITPTKHPTLYHIAHLSLFNFLSLSVGTIFHRLHQASDSQSHCFFEFFELLWARCFQDIVCLWFLFACLYNWCSLSVWSMPFFVWSMPLKAYMLLAMAIDAPSPLSSISKLGTLSLLTTSDGNQCPLFFLSPFS